MDYQVCGLTDFFAFFFSKSGNFAMKGKEQRSWGMEIAVLLRLMQKYLH